jgi:GxxExxY protein
MLHTAGDWAQINRISERIIGCAFAVSNGLGSGFLEKVYENALAHELRKAGLSVAQQHAMTATYDGVVVGEYVADLLVESPVLVGNRPASLPVAELRQAARRDSEDLAVSSNPCVSVFICG